VGIDGGFDPLLGSVIVDVGIDAPCCDIVESRDA
jgi:hypothetical protein